MKKLFLLGSVFLLICMTAMTVSGRQDRDGNEGAKDRFIGGWRLASLEEQGADGAMHEAACSGLLVYTRDGHMSVQVMYRNPPSGTGAAPVQASFGTYEIDESARTFTFHVEGALVRTLIGKDLPRSFEFSGKQLIVKSTHPDEHWRVVWGHY